MIKTRSEQFLENRNLLPEATDRMKKSVSEYRRNQINEDVENGFYKQGSFVANKTGKTTAGVVIGGGMSKTAQVVANTTSHAGTQGDTFRQGPEIYSPLWLTSNLSLPRDRVTVNAWSRAFFALNPIVQNAISLHSTYPISKLNIKCANKEVENFFQEMIDEIGLMNFCVEMAHEYWLLGEVFPYLEFDESTGKWVRAIIQNPDYMTVKRTVASNEPIIMMKPDEHLKKIVSSNKPSDVEERNKLSPHIIESIKRGGNIVLSNFNASYLSRKIAPYELRGTGLPISVFRQLMLFDMLRESKYVQASSMVNPTTVVKVGDGDYKPTQNDLESFRAIFEQAEHDKNFKIFTHNGVTIERVGFTGINDINPDITEIKKEIYIGLMVPSVVMDGGSDVTYANGGVALDVLRQRYITFRSIMTDWLKTKVFAPVSQANEFYEYDGEKKKLIIPDIEWNHMNLFDAGDYINALKELTAPDQSGKKRASMHTLYRSLGLDYEDEKVNMRKEAINELIAEKEREALKQYSLNDLRALSDDDEIVEKTTTVAGEQPTAGETPNIEMGGGSLPGSQ